MPTNKKNILTTLGIFFFFFLATSCWAGNLSLIEKRLKELDTLNKKAVKQATEIPRSGVIKATLKIPSGNSVEKLTVEDLTVTDFSSPSPFTIQVSSSPQQDRILEVARHLRKAGIPAFTSPPFQHEGKTWWRIYIGSYPTKIAAEKANKDFQAQMFPKGFVINLPYAIQVGTDMTAHEAAVIENQLLTLGYISYTSPGARKGLIKVLIGAFKTELEGKAALQNLTHLNISTSVVSR